MIQELFNSAIEWLKNNQFASGGLVLGVGAVAYRHGGKVLAIIKGFIWRRIFITVRMDRFNYGFEWMRSWLGDFLSENDKLIHEYEIKASNDGNRSDIALNQSDGRWFLTPEGFRVFVNMSRIEEKTDFGTRIYNKMTLTTGRWNKTKLRALMSKIGTEYGQKKAGKIYMPNQDGTDWVEWCDVPATKIEHVILDSDTKDKLLDDLQQFLDSEERYRELGLSYKRGYLLYGPPGNGKTSLIRALANHLNKSIAFVKGSSLRFSDVQQLIGRTGSDKLIVIEDIDRSTVVNEQRPQKTDEKETTDVPYSRTAGNILQDILNLMDGVQGGNGQIIITTANHPERLDKAFLRPGRIDRQVELANASKEQAHAIFIRFFGEGCQDLAKAFADNFEPGKLSMAQLQQIILANLEDPTAAINAMANHTAVKHEVS